MKKTALITGASKGLGYALAEHLAVNGWNLLVTARNPKELFKAKSYLEQFTSVIAIAGDVRDEIHLLQVAEELLENHWRLDLVVNNASALGISPLRPLLDHPVDDLHLVFHTNMIAPVSMLQKVQGFLNSGATVINISSDAGVEPYAKWGAYGGSKAGLDHMTAILAKENLQWRFYAFDPGDMQTGMQQLAFPGQDITDRPLPQEMAIPAIALLIENLLPSGRYTTSILKGQAV